MKTLMCNCLIIINLFVFSFSNLISQVKAEHKFVGTVQFLDESIISYELVFDEMENGEIIGKSISDFSGEHRTESNIKGTLNRKQKTISFNELDVISTNSDITDSDFCFVHLYNAKVKLRKKKSVIQGHFYSRFENGEVCLEGDIFLVGSDIFFKKMKKLVKKIDRFAPDSIAQVAKKQMPLASKNYLIESGNSVRVITKEDHVEINVWDEERLDGDAISIYINDSLYIDKYYIQYEKQAFNIYNLSDTTKLTFLANNEGSVPPNSAKVSISNESLELPMNVRLKKNKKADVLIIRK